MNPTEIRRLALALSQARQLKDNRAQPLAIVNDIAPALTSRFGAGPVTAAKAVVSFSHVGRCRNEAAFAPPGAGDGDQPQVQSHRRVRLAALGDHLGHVSR